MFELSFSDDKACNCNNIECNTVDFPEEFSPQRSVSGASSISSFEDGLIDLKFERFNLLSTNWFKNGRGSKKIEYENCMRNFCR